MDYFFLNFTPAIVAITSIVIISTLLHYFHHLVLLMTVRDNLGLVWLIKFCLIL